MIKVLFVCLGNICRSPMAEAIFKDLVRKEKLTDHVSCDSAGTANYHIGDNPDPRTISTVNLREISIDHKGRQFSSDDFNYFQYIVVMDQSNLRDVLFKGGKVGENVFLMRDFDPDHLGRDVPDPYYGGQSGFDDVFEILNRSCRQLLKLIGENRKLSD